jgi:hypothetical protein
VVWVRSMWEGEESRGAVWCDVVWVRSMWEGEERRGAVCCR